MQCSFMATITFFVLLIDNLSAEETSTVATDPMAKDVYVTHEKRDRLPRDWSKQGKCSSDSILPMRIGLTQQNLKTVDKLLMDVSDPKSAKYGQHMTPAQIAKTFAPSRETVSAVVKWLRDFGIKTTDIKKSASRGWLSFNLTVAQAEQLLKTEYDIYQHKSGKLLPATTDYSVPAYIQQHIDIITPTVHFDVKVRVNSKKGNNMKKCCKKDGVKSMKAGLDRHARNKRVTDLDNCDRYITPICLKTLYNFNHYKQRASTKNNYGIVEYTPQSFVQADLDIFFNKYDPRVQNAKPIFASIDGGVLDIADTGTLDINGESNLDFQYAMPLVTPTPVILYQTGDLVESASFNNFLDGIDAFYCTFDGGDDPTQDSTFPDPLGYEGPEDCGKYKPTYVISTSYDYNEADFSPAYEGRQCFEYAKLGLQGVTILYSSGDHGVAGNGGQCIDPITGTYATDPSGIKFNPSFPGTCPYITSVGATQVNPNSNVYQPESASDQVIYSGGGFSNVFPLPSYQKSAVENFLTNHKPQYNSAQYNNSGMVRAYPDISANGANYRVFIGGQPRLVSGTSASCPVVGAIITLINDARLADGKSPVGFLNPTLYANPDALNDITSGNNPGCGTNGFSAVKGWDPVTGLGTPNFEKLRKVFLSLP